MTQTSTFGPFSATYNASAVAERHKPMKAAKSGSRIERIVALNRAGLNSSQIGARIGISAGAVRVALHKERTRMAMDAAVKQNLTR
ncbi:MAG: hypothetical protein WBW93_16435 [Steroidobacteraceae bacterium]